tara:strand:- start:381 stop:569 length:189 start_codon:yes stop_codon:yes gene_type:complete
LFEGSEDSQLSGDSKLIPATVNFSAETADVRKITKKRLQSNFVMVSKLYFYFDESTDKVLVL